MNYIKSMRGVLKRQTSYGSNGFELQVTVEFDAKQFNAIKKSEDPLGAGMGQIKNVVYDSTGISGTPSYAPVSYSQKYPRARLGVVTLTVKFEVSEYTAKQLGADTKDYCLHKTIELNETLELTRKDGHLLAKTAIASHFGH